MVRGRPRSVSGLTGIWAIGYARTCPEWVVGENSGCGIRDNEFAWCFCWGECQLFLNLRLARPLPKHNPRQRGGAFVQGRCLSGLPGLCLPRRGKQRPHGFANGVVVSGAHTIPHRAGAERSHLSCLSPHPRGAGIEIQARRHASQRIPDGRICGGLRSTYFLPPCWRITAAAS